MSNGGAAQVPASVPRPSSVAGAVAQFVVAGLVAVIAFGAASIFLLRELGRREAVNDARELAVVAAQGIVEPALAGVPSGGRDAIARLDRIVQERVLSDRVVRVKIWSPDGRIVYSDEPRLIGARYRLGEDEREALADGRPQAELSDLSRPENRFERGQGDLYEVYTRVRAPDGTPLLFETYQRSSSLVSRGRDVWRPFAVPLLASVILLWLVQVPLAWRLASRLRRTQLEREALLVHAVESSADERRRIAADLHDGPVQDLAGLSYSLTAAADGAPRGTSPELVSAVRSAAGAVRSAIRQLRTLLVEIHPPNLRSAGLRAALADRLSRLSASGVETSIDVDDDLRLDADTELLLFRGAAEALRNVQRHAHASTVEVAVFRADGAVRVEVVDDGVGIARETLERRRAEGHVGLSLVEELAARRGGRVDLQARPGGGTVFALEVPSS
jgi:signal transduction histidine kinase